MTSKDPFYFYLSAPLSKKSNLGRIKKKRASYEVETTNKKTYHQRWVGQYGGTGVEVIIIPTNKLPFDIWGRYKAAKQYINPD